MHGERIYAVDNRCPHMGFPLDRGSVKDCILTCHWHHARFDLASGGTFDPWADDVRVFPVDVRDHEVWVDLALRDDLNAYQRMRVREGLEQNTAGLAKAVIRARPRENPRAAFRTDGSSPRSAGGLGPGPDDPQLQSNLLPRLQPKDRPVLLSGLSAVASTPGGAPPRLGCARCRRRSRPLRQALLRQSGGPGFKGMSAYSRRAKRSHHRQLAECGLPPYRSPILQSGTADCTNKASKPGHRRMDMAESVLAASAWLASADRMEE